MTTPAGYLANEGALTGKAYVTKAVYEHPDGTLRLTPPAEPVAVTSEGLYLDGDVTDAEAQEALSHDGENRALAGAMVEPEEFVPWEEVDEEEREAWREGAVPSFFPTKEAQARWDYERYHRERREILSQTVAERLFEKCDDPDCIGIEGHSHPVEAVSGQSRKTWHNGATPLPSDGPGWRRLRVAKALRDRFGEDHPGRDYEAFMGDAEAVLEALGGTEIPVTETSWAGTGRHGVSPEDQQAIVDQFFAAYPGLRSWLTSMAPAKEAPADPEGVRQTLFAVLARARGQADVRDARIADALLAEFDITPKTAEGGREA